MERKLHCPYGLIFCSCVRGYILDGYGWAWIAENLVLSSRSVEKRNSSLPFFLKVRHEVRRRRENKSSVSVLLLLGERSDNNPEPIRKLAIGLLWVISLRRMSTVNNEATIRWIGTRFFFRLGVVCLGGFFSVELKHDQYEFSFMLNVAPYVF